MRVVFAAVVALAGCLAPVQAEELPIFVRASHFSDYFLAARLQGELYLDDAGCLRVASRQDDPGPFVVWSYNSRIERTDDGRIRITDGFNGKVAHVGDQVVMGGGIMTTPPTQGLTEPIPQACASGTFLVTSQLGEAVDGSETSPMIDPSRFGSMSKPGPARPEGVSEDYVPKIPAHEMEPDTGPLVAALQERFRDRIAGIYIERDPDFHVVVRLTGNRDAGTLQYQLGEDRVRVEVEAGAQHTLEQLQAVLKNGRETIDRMLPTAHARFVDARTGEIEIAVDLGDNVSLGQRDALSAELGVPVRIVEKERAVARLLPASKMELAISGESERLRGKYRERLAGLHVEPAARRITVRLTGTDPVEDETYSIDGETLQIVYEVGAPHTLTELLTVGNEGRRKVRAILPNAHVDYVDERTGEVVIAVSPAPEDISGAQNDLASALGVPVRIEIGNR